MIHSYSLSSGSKRILSLFPINLSFLFNLLMILWGKDSHFISSAPKAIANKTQQIPIQRTSEELMRRRCHKTRRGGGLWKRLSNAEEVTQPSKPQLA